VAAQATLQGAFAPLRVALGAVTIAGPGVLPGSGWIWAAVIGGLAALVVWRSGARVWPLAGAALLGALVPVAWVGTGYVLYDDFDAIPLEGLAFTGPFAETLCWGVAAQVTSAGFGAGLVGGVLAGALLAAVGSRSFRVESFESAGQMGRSLSGAVLMGVGGVLAGGCTVGAGLAGVPTLGLAALIAVASIVAGVYGADAALSRRGAGRMVAAE
jgi:hypothetical protein